MGIVVVGEETYDKESSVTSWSSYNSAGNECQRKLTLEHGYRLTIVWERLEEGRATIIRMIEDMSQNLA